MYELKKYIQVDIYGKCGNLTCANEYDWASHDCLDMLNTTYMFYLSFENSLCLDYITDKFYRAIAIDVVPIVRGGTGQQEYTKLVPRNWFINTAEFSSPKYLAEYLLYLKDNPVEYAKYFHGRDLYDINCAWSLGGCFAQIDWCKFCEKLNDDSQPNKTIPDITKFWNVSNCINPADHLNI